MNISTFLESLDKAMVTVKGIAETPGVNMLPYVSVISSIIGAGHAAYTAGKNMAPFVEAIDNTFQPGTIPSPEAVAKLELDIKALEGEVDAPLPPREEGEPE